MVIRREDNALIASYGNMTLPLELGGLPATSAIEPLFSMLSGAADMLGATVREDKDRLAKWWEERQMREAAEVYQ